MQLIENNATALMHEINIAVFKHIYSHDDVTS